MATASQPRLAVDTISCSGVSRDRDPTVNSQPATFGQTTARSKCVPHLNNMVPEVAHPQPRGISTGGVATPSRPGDTAGEGSLTTCTCHAYNELWIEKQEKAYAAFLL